MANFVNFSTPSEKDSAGIGVPEESIGFILQRGGEELALEKTVDRFTLRPAGDTCDCDWEKIIPAQRLGRVPRVMLEEFKTKPEELEAAMEAARRSPEVAFVSHVYRVKNNPELLVYLTNEVTVQFSEEVGSKVQEALAYEFRLRLVREVPGIANTYIFQLSEQARENPVKIANRLTCRPEVLIAEPNIVIQTSPYYRPRDPLYSKQWYLYNSGGQDLAPGSHIDIEKAWDITRGVRSVVVAIIDDSVDLNHPDFQGIGKIVAPKDFKEKDFLPLPGEDEDNHGTSCAGIAVAEENGIGIVGVAPGCALMPIRSTGFLDDEAIEEMFAWAMEKGASVISCSWGPSAIYFPLSLRQSAAIHRAATEGRNGKGCVIVFAAGNANRPTTGTINERNWPNNILSGPTKWLGGFTVHPDVIVVSSCTSLNKKAAYSNWGPTISVCAPSNNAPPGIWLQETGFISTGPEVKAFLAGVGIFTTDRLGVDGYEAGDFTAYFGGTSSAAPIVAGVAALVLSVNPNLTAQQVKQILQRTADKIIDRDPDPQLGLTLGTYDANGFSQWFGYGKVNAYKAVLAAQQHLAASTLRVSKYLQGRNDSKIEIPDDNPQGGGSAIRVNDADTVKDVRVSVDIEHSFLGDLEIYLVAPSGKSVLLQGRTLGCNKRLQVTYSLQQTPVLRLLLGESTKGVWQLRVVDCAPEDIGRLNSWELTLGV